MSKRASRGNTQSPPTKRQRKATRAVAKASVEVSSDNDSDDAMDTVSEFDLKKIEALIDARDAKLLKVVKDEAEERDAKLLESVKKLVESANKLPGTVCHDSGSSPSALTAPVMSAVSVVKQIPKDSRDALRNYLRFRWYERNKFLTDEQAMVVLNSGRASKKLDNNITSCRQIQNAMSDLRQNSRTGAKNAFIDAMTGKKNSSPLPIGFPDAIVPDIGLNGRPKLKDCYRTYGDTVSNAEVEKQFVWFVENIVAKINPTRQQYRSRCAHHEISSMFTPSDEAWGLMMLLNDCKVWEWEAAKQMSNDPVAYARQNTRPRSRFTSRANTSSKKSWASSDIDNFEFLTALVAKRRKNTDSEKWEADFMTKKHREKLIAAGGGLAAGGSDVDSDVTNTSGEEQVDWSEDQDMYEAKKMAAENFAASLAMETVPKEAVPLETVCNLATV